MKTIHTFEGNSISDLYAADTAEEKHAFMLSYPSTAQWEPFPNVNKFPIHDGGNQQDKVPEHIVKQKEPYRHLAVLGKGIPAFLTVLPPQELIGYWQEHFSMGLADIIALPKDSYCDVINASEWKVITLFPFEHIAADKHAVNPDNHYFVLDKTTLPQMGIPLPPQQVISPHLLPAYKDKIPFVVKTAQGLSGDGTFIIKTPADFDKCLQKVKDYGLQEVIMQQLVQNIKTNHGVQFYLSKQGKITFIGSSHQLTDAEGHYQGNVVSYSQMEMEKFLPIIKNVAAFLQQHGYFGIAGLDILEDTEGQLFVIDGNFRLTGATPQYMLKNDLMVAGFGHSKICTEYGYHGQLKDFLRSLKEELTGKIFTILSAYENNGKTEVYGITAGHSLKEISTNEQKLFAKGLTIN